MPTYHIADVSNMFRLSHYQALSIGDGAARHGLYPVCKAGQHLGKGQRPHHGEGRHGDGVPPKVHLQVQRPDRHALSRQGGHRGRTLSCGEGTHKVAIREGRLRRLGNSLSIRLYPDYGGADGL